MTDTYGREHWNQRDYRGPEHPVVQVYARAKLDMLEQLLGAVQGGGWAARRAANVLDLGAGPGIFSAPLAEIFRNLTVLDYHDRMLARNPAKARVRGDALRLPFADGVFDLVFEANMLHHLDNPMRCLLEAKRVLASGGAMLCVEPNRWNPLMVGAGLVMREEHRLLRYSGRHMAYLAMRAGLELAARCAAGHIFQNTTPEWMLPVLKPLERVRYPFGAYQLCVLLKP